MTVSVSAVVLVTASKAPALSVPGDQTLTVGSTLRFTVNATDADPGAVILLSATGLPPGATFDLDTGVFYWKPNAGQTGSYSFVFSATDKNNPSQQDMKPMAVVVVPASPGSTNGGSGGGSSGYCLSCAIMPLVSSPIGLLATGGLLGLIVSLAVVTMSARSSLENTKRRMKRLTRNE